MNHQPQCAREHGDEGPCFTEAISWGGRGSAWVEFADTGPIVLPDIPPDASIPLHRAGEFADSLLKLAQDLRQQRIA